MADKDKGTARQVAIDWATTSAEILAKHGAPLSAADFQEIAELLGAGVPDKVLEAMDELRVAGKEGRIAGIQWFRPMVGDHAGEVDGEPLRPGPRMYLQVAIEIPIVVGEAES